MKTKNHIKRSNITKKQKKVILFLGENDFRKGGVGGTDLARFMGVAHSGGYDFLERLREKKIVKKRRGFRPYYLTQKGRRIADYLKRGRE